MPKLTDKKSIDRIFSQLEKLCSKEKAYSVNKYAAKLSIPYTQIQEWAAQNESWSDILEFCHCMCCCHAVTDGLTFKLSRDKILLYWKENDDEFAARYDELIALHPLDNES